MKLIVGLGNPGEKYRSNRHNVGYLIIDNLKKHHLPKGCCAAKTNSFMNSSGAVVKKLLKKSLLTPDDLYVIHDDLDLSLGSYKIQFGKGPKIHKGLLSINEALGTNGYWRVRVGVDNRQADKRTVGEEYVLENFSREEEKIIKDVATKLTNELISHLKP